MKIIKKAVVKLNIMNIFSIPFYIFRIFKIDSNKIICINYNGRGYGDNPKYIVDELLREKNQNLKIIWPTKKLNSNFPNGIIPVRIYGLKFFYHMATAKIWINTCRFPLFIKKREGQYYIQTWHGGLGIKKIEADVEETLPEYYIKSAKNDSKMIDYMISNCKHIENLYRKCFWYNGEVLGLGFPRNDILFKQEAIKEVNFKIKEMYNISKEKKIILYVPTFRDNYEFDYLSIDYKKIISELKKKYGEEYVFAIRLHPKVANIYDFENENIYDFTNYPDVYELLLATDILISDYSSVLFDFIYLNRPIYLYAPDYNKYMDDRGSYIEYKELPFSIAYSAEQLTNNIINKKNDEKENELKKFIEDNELLDDGHASERVCELINKLRKDEKIEGKES